MEKLIETDAFLFSKRTRNNREGRKLSFYEVENEIRRTFQLIGASVEQLFIEYYNQIADCFKRISAYVILTNRP